MSKSELKELQKIKAVKLHEQNRKQFLNPTPTPKIAHQGPKKSNRTPKLSQDQKSELKELQKIKVVQLHEQAQKQFLNPIPTPKIDHQGPAQLWLIQLNLNQRIQPACHLPKMLYCRQKNCELACLPKPLIQFFKEN